MQFFVMQILNSISYGSLLFMIASGFSLIFGLMRITNMTHVVFFMMGAYFSYFVYGKTGSFLLGLLAAAVATSLIGFIVFRFFLFRLQGQGQSQVLLCLGFLFFFDDALLAVFGGYPQLTQTPKALEGSVKLMGLQFPTYRLMLIAVGILIAVVLNLVVNKTKLGALVRSGVDDQETVRAMGVDINKLFVLVYVGGTFLAAVGGGLGGVVLGMEPKMCFNLLPIALAVVIIGGLGDLNGAFYSSMIVAALDNFGKVLFPALSYFTIFLPMAIILVFKPEGLFARRKKSIRKAVKRA